MDMKRWSCAALVAWIVVFMLGCGAQEGDNAQYQAGYDDGYRVGFARGQEEAAAGLGGQATQAPAASVTRPVVTPASTPRPAATPEMPILIDPTPTPSSPGETSAPTYEVPLLQGVVQGAQVNMRSGPGSEYEVVHTVSPQTQVEIFGGENGWYLVKVDGIEGYILMDLVTLRYSGGSFAAQEPAYVWVRSAGSSYHAVNDCSYTNPNTASLVTLAEAKRRGLTACTICFAQSTESAVWLSLEARCYHSFSKCSEIGTASVVEIPLSEARRRSIRPCDICRPPV